MLRLKMKKIKINFKKGREKIFLNVEEMKGINKFLGLMVYKKNLLFRFKEGKRAIHSILCKPFVAIWINRGKIVEIKKISSWKLSITPKKNFDILIEIPFKNNNSRIIKFLLDKERISVDNSKDLKRQLN
jgi:hypothetical protein